MLGDRRFGRAALAAAVLLIAPVAACASPADGEPSPPLRGLAACADSEFVALFLGLERGAAPASDSVPASSAYALRLDGSFGSVSSMPNVQSVEIRADARQGFLVEVPDVASYQGGGGSLDHGKQTFNLMQLTTVDLSSRTTATQSVTGIERVRTNQDGTKFAITYGAGKVSTTFEPTEFERDVDAVSVVSSISDLQSIDEARVLTETFESQIANVIISPDGTQLAYTRILGPPFTTTELHTYDLETGQVQVIYQPSPDVMAYVSAWSPDGSRVLAVQFDNVAVNDTVTAVEIDIDTLLVSEVGEIESGFPVYGDRAGDVILQVSEHTQNDAQVVSLLRWVRGADGVLALDSTLTLKGLAQAGGLRVASCAIPA